MVKHVLVNSLLASYKFYNIREIVCVGIKVKEGVVIAVEKKLNSVLVDETSFKKIQLLGEHIGVSYAGIGPDFRVLNQKARKTV